MFFKSKSQKQKPYRFQIKVEIEVWGRFQAKLWIICVIDGCKFLQKVAFYLYCQSKNTLNKTNLPSDYKIRVHSFRFQVRTLKLRQKGIYLMISNQVFIGASKNLSHNLESEFESCSKKCLLTISFQVSINLVSIGEKFNAQLNLKTPGKNKYWENLIFKIASNLYLPLETKFDSKIRTLWW